MSVKTKGPTIRDLEYLSGEVNGNHRRILELDEKTSKRLASLEDRAACFRTELTNMYKEKDQARKTRINWLLALVGLLVAGALVGAGYIEGKGNKPAQEIEYRLHTYAVPCHAVDGGS